MSISDLIWLRNEMLKELAEKDADFFPATKDDLHRLRWLEQAIMRAAKGEAA